MNPIILVQDRYNGAYSDCLWTAWAYSVPEAINDSDVPCMMFWQAHTGQGDHGRGKTAEEALKDFLSKHAYEAGR